MQASEAITLLINSSDLLLNAENVEWETEEDKQRLELAIAISQAMLNSMIPVARFRAHVEVESQPRKRHPVANVTEEFTVSGVTMEAIKSGVSGVSLQDIDIRIVIFEQTPEGAHMVSGFQGPSKSQRYRAWFNSLDSLVREDMMQ